MHVSKESLEKTHGAKAEAVWKEICLTGGFGDVPFGHGGGLDLAGIPDAKTRDKCVALATGEKAATK